eukprot:g51548.t1
MSAAPVPSPRGSGSTSPPRPGSQGSKVSPRGSTELSGTTTNPPAEGSVKHQPPPRRTDGLSAPVRAAPPPRAPAKKK